MAGTPETIEKIMSLTLADFHRSVRVLAPDLTPGHGQTEVVVPDGAASVRITYEPLESTTLGGLLALPRARVTISHDSGDPGLRAAFLARFDQAFQRGGG